MFISRKIPLEISEQNISMELEMRDYNRKPQISWTSSSSGIAGRQPF